MDAIEYARSLDEQFTQACTELDQDEPWFGEFALKVGKDLRTYKVGKLRAAHLHVVAANSPLAKAYYECEPGDSFDFDGSRLQLASFEGTLHHKAKLASRQRRIQRLDYSDIENEVVVVRKDHGFEVVVDAASAIDTQTGLPNILALLTREQYRLIAQARQQPVIIQGKAGSGKTSVALYRVAWLANPVEGSGQPAVDPSRVLIVMFNKALSMFVRAALPELHLERAILNTFHAFAFDQVKRAYKGDLKIDTSELPGKAQADALKKNIGVLRAVEAFAYEQEERLRPWLVEKLAPYKAQKWLDAYSQSKSPLARRLADLRNQAAAEKHAAAGIARERLEQVHAVFTQAVRRVTQYKEELARILTDRELLAKHVVNVPAQDIDALIEYQKALSAKGGTDRRPGPFVSFADLALLLRLIQIKNGGFPSDNEAAPVDLYDHVVIDEAQDFGAVELTVLLSAVRSRTGVTIAGDLNQKIVPDVASMGWDALARELGIDGVKVAKLDVAHRATLPIMRVADSIVKDQTTKGRPGPRPTLTVTGPVHQIDAAVEIVREMLDEAPRAHVCVVFRRAHQSRLALSKFADALAELNVPVRLGYNDEFIFAPGVTVTNLRQIKGLEFDAVVALDATAENYPADDQGRRNLYTMLTRAKDRLAIVSPGEPTPLLGDAMRDGRLDVRQPLTVPAVNFGPEDDLPV